MSNSPLPRRERIVAFVLLAMAALFIGWAARADVTPPGRSLSHEIPQSGIIDSHQSRNSPAIKSST